MRSVEFILIFAATHSSLCDLNIYNKARNFGFELLYKIHDRADIDGDVVISPFAVWHLLVCTAYETAGETREQALKVFSLTEEINEVLEGFANLKASVLVNQSVYIMFHNFLFYDESLNVDSNSIRRFETDFLFVTRRLNFDEPQDAVQNAIQTFKDHGVPPGRHILRSEDFANSTMIMGNYLEFEAKWAQPFKISDTVVVRKTDGLLNVQSIYIMSTRGRFRSSNIEYLKATVTELPYEGDKFCMLLIRPYNGIRVKHVYRKLRNSEVSLRDMLIKLESDADELGLREIEVKLPTYYNNSLVILNKPLFEMGLTDVLDRGDANFENISEDGIFISEIVHGASVYISEQKTYIYSYTPAYAFTYKKLRVPRKEIDLDEPSIYLIVEKTTTTVLFAGDITKIKNVDW